MLAPKNKYIQEASDPLYKLSNDEAVRMHCIDLDDLHRRQRTQEIYWQSIQKKYDSIKDILASKDKIISEKGNAISEMDKIISEKDKIISEMEAEIARLKSLLSGKEI